MFTTYVLCIVNNCIFSPKLCNASQENRPKVISIGKNTKIVLSPTQSHVEGNLLDGYSSLISNLQVRKLA